MTLMVGLLDHIRLAGGQNDYTAFGRYSRSGRRHRGHDRSGPACALTATATSKLRPAGHGAYIARARSRGLGLVIRCSSSPLRTAVDYKYLRSRKIRARLIFRRSAEEAPIGYAVFGAIFANQLTSHSAAKLPARRDT